MKMSFPSSALESNFFASLMHSKSASNDSIYTAYDFPFDANENPHYNSSLLAPAGESSQHLTSILQQLFNRMSDNNSLFRSYSSSRASPSASSTPVYPSFVHSVEILFPSHSPELGRSFHYFALISLWFVLIINPIVVTTHSSTGDDAPRNSFLYLDSLWCDR